MKYFKFFPIWITAVFFLFVLSTYAQSEERRQTKKSTTRTEKNYTKRQPASHSTNNIWASDVGMPNNEYNIRTDLFRLIDDRIFNVDFDIGMLKDNITIGPTLGIRSSDFGLVKLSIYVIGARMNYYFNHKRFTNGIIFAPSVGVNIASFKETVLATEYTGNTTNLWFRALALYQYWITGQGVDGLNINGGLGLIYNGGSSGLTLKSSTGTTLAVAVPMSGGVDFSAELGVGYSF
ncbi:MAG: hypothetical protein HY843_07020 [Bdellovibrio sp.]|nr:hypothetical protein [Bdellovibrio sp.]